MRAFPEVDLYPGDDQYPAVADVPDTGGRWYDWWSISREVRQTYAEEAARQPTGCPSCGEPLVRERSVLRCPFDGAQF